MENSQHQQKHNHHGLIFFNFKPSNQTIPFNLSCTKSSSFDRLIPKVSFFPAFLNKSSKDAKVLKEELLDAIEPLDREAEATPEDQQRVDELARKLKAVNPTKQPLKSDLLDGKWELIYTTSQSILQTQANHGTNCEEVISVERAGECLIIHFNCPCSKDYQTLLSGNSCYYKLM